jgi:hypothetical protein
MSEPAAIAIPAGREDPPAPAAAAAELARSLITQQLGMLGRLAEVGLNVALAVERQALEAASAAPPGELALAYGRVSRAVRLTIALQARLLKDLQELDDVAARKQAREQADAGRERQIAEAARKARVERIVERLIHDEAADEGEADRLADEAYERLEHDDIYGDLLDRPVSEIIERVCKDLGLAPDWSRLAQEAWARDEIAAGAAGSPLASLRWLDPPGPEPACAGRLPAQPLLDAGP